MANSNRGNKNRDVVSDFTAAVIPDAVAKAPAAEAVAPVVSSRLNSKVRETLDTAMRGATVKIKSEANYEAAQAVIKSSNPLELKLVHKPGLGHHSIAVR